MCMFQTLSVIFFLRNLGDNFAGGFTVGSSLVRLQIRLGSIETIKSIIDDLCKGVAVTRP